MTTKFLTAGLTLLMIVSACTKNQVMPLEEEMQSAANNSGNNCHSIEFPEIFSKTYDPVTGLLKSITAASWSGGGVYEYFTYDVLWLPGKVLFHQKGDETNYALAASLNKAGQVIRTTVGNQITAGFLNSVFTYSGNTLKKIEMEFAGGREWEFKYDRKGNCILIDKDAGGQSGARVIYEYDLTKKAKNQHYDNESRGWIDDTYALLLYAGLLPSAVPVNLRTRATVIWDGDYQASDVVFSHHQLDKNKNLYSYRVNYPSSSSTKTEYISWSCPSKGKGLE